MIAGKVSLRARRQPNTKPNQVPLARSDESTRRDRPVTLRTSSQLKFTEISIKVGRDEAYAVPPCCHPTSDPPFIQGLNSR